MIDHLRMLNGYKPPKFQQFDGNDNPKQHVAHFIETCETAGTRGDLLVKQFVRILKEMPSTSTSTWNMNPLTVGSILRGTFAIASTVADVSSA